MPEAYYLAVAAVIFCLGAIGLLLRRNLLIQLMSLELMLNAINVTLVALNRGRQDDATGHLFAFYIITVAAAEACVGLSIALSFYRLRRSTRSDEADLLKN